MIIKEKLNGGESRNRRIPVVYEEVSEDDRIRNDVWALMDIWSSVRGNILLAGRDEKTMNTAERRALRYWEDKLFERQMQVKWIFSGKDESMSYRDFLESQTTVIDGTFVGEAPNTIDEYGEPVSPQSPFASLAERFFYAAMQRIGIMTKEHSLDEKNTL